MEEEKIVQFKPNSGLAYANLVNEIESLQSKLRVAEESLSNISECKHLPNCGYIHAPCICLKEEGRCRKEVV